MRCLQVALTGNADVNNVSETGMPVFLLACEQAQDCEGMCLSILERGADPNATNQVCKCCVIDNGIFEINPLSLSWIQTNGPSEILSM